MTLAKLLATERPTEVVDIGANPIDGTPPYRPLLDAGLCRVIGFEPLVEPMAKLLAAKGPYERYLPYAIADGARQTLTVCRAAGMTSTLEPDLAAIDIFTCLSRSIEVSHRAQIPTRRLDDVAEVEHIDMLKIDIQGGEMAAFRGGRRKLAKALVVQTEVAFVTIYDKQPTFAEIDLELRQQGFLPHAMVAVRKWPIAPCVVDRELFKPINQLLEADMVYVRGLTGSNTLSHEQLKHLALIAHYCYGSYDLALRCLVLLERRRAVAPDVAKRYMAAMTDPGISAITSVVRA